MLFFCKILINCLFCFLTEIFTFLGHFRSNCMNSQICYIKTCLSELCCSICIDVKLCDVRSILFHKRVGHNNILVVFLVSSSSSSVVFMFFGWISRWYLFVMLTVLLCLWQHVSDCVRTERTCPDVTLLWGRVLTH